MATLQFQAEAVRAAVASTTTCTPATVVSVKALLLRETEPAAISRHARATSTSRPTTAASSRPGTATAKRRPAAARDDPEPGLSDKERAQLATQIINAALKALTEAAKPTPTAPAAPPAASSTTTPPADTPIPPARTTDDTALKRTARDKMQRSMSAPMSPLQPRTLNRVATSPSKAAGHGHGKPAASSTHNAQCLAAVECLRIAFTALRSLQDCKAVALPELQLEAGISSFVAKLLALNMLDQACTQLRLLKKRLQELTPAETAPAPTKGKAPRTIAKAPAPAPAEAVSLGAELLDFGDVTALPLPAVKLVVASQLQALRILAAHRKPAHIDAALPFLRRSYTSAPAHLIRHCCKAATGVAAEQQKCVRQMESLSQLLLALAPSISSKDDASATEPTLCIAPLAALELQTMSLETRLRCWAMAPSAKHDADKDVLLPFSRCLATYARRSRPSGPTSAAYATCKAFFGTLLDLVEEAQLPAARTSKAPLSAVFQCLAAMARETGLLDDAVHWSGELFSTMSRTDDSAARYCSAMAQLLSLQLKAPARAYGHDTFGLVAGVLALIQGPLKGDTAELEALLGNVCLVRKSAVAVLMAPAQAKALAGEHKRLLESFVCQCPRFCLRWLGKPPAAKSATKDFLRYEQRRQLLAQSIRPTLDSALVVTKALLDEGRMAWEQLDGVLSDALTVLEYLGDAATQGRDAAASYHVKISHFYYLGYNVLRRASAESNSSDSSDSTKALRRAIDCIKHRPAPEREKAQLVLKLERLAELAKAAGQIGEALGALQTVRACLVDDGALAQVVAALATQPPGRAWAGSEAVASLSRTLVAIHRLEEVHMDWSAGLDEPERAAVLEHRLAFVATKDRLGLGHACVAALLGIYYPTKYPLRRARTLLRVYAACLDAPEALAEVARQTQAALGLAATHGPGDDAGLVAYVPHYEALAASLAGFAGGFADTASLDEPVAAWTRLVDGCTTLADLEGVVDSVADLQVHLHSVAEYLRAMGRDAAVTRVLELSQRLSNLVNQSATTATSSLLSSSTTLAQESAFALSSHYLRTGDGAAAERILGEIQAFVESNPAHAGAAMRFHLTYAEFLVSAGRFAEAGVHLAQARPADAATHSVRLTGTQKRILGAQACILQSLVALESGDVPAALHNARGGVRMLFQDWSRLEKAMEESDTKEVAVTDQPASPAFWGLFHPLFDSMLRLSSIYAHLGLFQETMYYAEQALTVASATRAALALARAETWLAAVHLKAGALDKAAAVAAQARERLVGVDATSRKAALACELAEVYRQMGDHESAAVLVRQAETILRVPSPKAEAVVAEAKPARRTRAATTTTRATRTTRTTTSRTTTTTRATRTSKAPTKTAKAPTKTAKTTQPDETAAHPSVVGLHAALVAQKAMWHLSRKDWAAALALLRGAAAQVGAPRAQADILAGHLALAACLLGHSTEQMARDAVFSVIQDSTLSFPAVASGADDGGRFSLASAALARSPGKVRAPPGLSATPGFVAMLQEAQDCLIEAQARAVVAGDSVTLNRVSSMLQSAFLVLSATAGSVPRALGHPGYASCAVELARNMTWQRERRAVLVEKSERVDRAVRSDVTWWPSVAASLKLDDEADTSDVSIARFQRDYIDLIPGDWSVVSLALSENKHDLCITKLQAGQSPFVIRLPLERATSRDADSEVFNFAQGRAELLAIVQAINDSCHGARGVTADSKAAWWAAREALDARLGTLLAHVEQIWLGGFRGIFAPRARQPAGLARFRKTFQGILDKHLPSRRKKTAHAQAQKRVDLDARVLDLFIGLGDATADGCDFDDALDDLLYFVVDILQFHGEHNAYDEIDFDSMVVATFDALYAYHAAHQAAPAPSTHGHTILVLDKALHVFPWESLPCMQARAVSRVPSMACLRRLILDQQVAATVAATGPGGAPSGARASRARGAYMLNPTGDLPATEATFDAPLTTSLHGPAWTRIVGRAPTEAEFEAVLADKDVLLYFGHGSGAQYIRGRTVRALPRCRATALLMGCSSAGLNYNGDFELHGTAWDYMLAGCPAVVGTLWDVTDKDIDRLAATAFEAWGLVAPGAFRGLTSSPDSRVDNDNDNDTCSLVEALVRARSAPRFRYLTAAAVCVYGIPVYLD